MKTINFTTPIIPHSKSQIGKLLFCSFISLFAVSDSYRIIDHGWIAYTAALYKQKYIFRPSMKGKFTVRSFTNPSLCIMQIHSSIGRQRLSPKCIFFYISSFFGEGSHYRQHKEMLNHNIRFVLFV